MPGVDLDVARLFLIACAGVCVVLAFYFFTAFRHVAGTGSPVVSDGQRPKQLPDRVEFRAAVAGRVGTDNA
jgi:hypothetical protein